jgi:hypothetical protein
MIGLSSSTSVIGFKLSLTDVVEETLTINPVNVRLPKGATALTPLIASSSNSFGTK